MIALKVDNVTKHFTTSEGVAKVLSHINLTLNNGEILGIRGENGSGKTTLFNIIAGIERPNVGQVLFGEQSGIIPKLGVVFQNYASTLLPWLNVKENICIPLKIKGLNKSERDRKLKDVIATLKFETLSLKNYPHQLSGGQRQKVAIARALIHEPNILILDEPFSNLDFQASLELQDALQKIHSDKGTTILVVSHNIDHILYLANRVLVLSGHPSSIAAEFLIDIPHPRERAILVSKEFEDLRNRILEFEYASYQKRNKNN